MRYLISTTVLAVIAVCCVVVGISGCGSAALTEYEPYPVYPLRQDPIVISNPADFPKAVAPPGELDAWLMGHNSLGGKVLDSKRLTEEQKSALSKVIDSLFGTPAKPKVNSPLANSLGLTNDEELANASKLYRRHCSNCHGLNCDGRGPAGLFVYPHPRDIRLGKNKFGKTIDGTPTREDLYRVIKAGVPGTSMPPFILADENILQHLVTATIHLSLKGEVELKLMTQLLNDDAPENLEAEGQKLLDSAIQRWQSAQTVKAVKTPDNLQDFDRIRRGHDLFLSKKAGCVSCHLDYGKNVAYRYDFWGTAAKVPDLSERKLRGGSEPGDVFARLKTGIPAVGMPAQSQLTDEEVWDLAAFILAMPLAQRLPDELRKVIHTGQ